MKPRIVWFRSDLRIRDNGALHAAQDGGGNVIPAFILDPKTFKAEIFSQAKARFIYRTLQNLMQNLEKRNSRLVIRVGDAKAELLKLAGETGAKEIYLNRRYRPDLYKIDEKLKKELESKGLKVKIFHGETVLPPDSIMNGKKPVASFIEYRDKWLQTERPPISPNIEMFKAYGPISKGKKALNELHSDVLPDLKNLGLSIGGKIPTAGEDEGLDNLSWFFDRRVMYYNVQRAYPQVEGTSKLSPFITVGSLSPNLVLSLLETARKRATETQRASVDNWMVSYIWRDFYHQLVFHYPRIVKEPYRKEFIDFPFENKTGLFDAFKQGATGFPLIDAGVKQMTTDFWMHGRLRVITASFLVKNLLIDWRTGVELYLDNMLDGDLATSIGSFQWVACSGAEREQAGEVIDPVHQSRVMDPQGNFIRKYLPVLAKVPDEYIHTPWLMPANIQLKCGVTVGKNYPTPVVDLKKSSAKFLKLIKSI